MLNADMSDYKIIVYIDLETTPGTVESVNNKLEKLLTSQNISEKKLYFYFYIPLIL